MTHTDNNGDNAEQREKRYYYHSDHLGSAQFVTDWRGKQYEHIEYTPYGELWIEEVAAGLDKLPFRFTGKEMDEETGLYYDGARYLDPKYSRWLSTDPALGEYVSGTEKGEGGIYNGINFNLYHYANNNPVKYTDPNGEWAHIVVGAAIGAGVGAISAWASGASGREIVAAAVGGAVTGGMAAATCGMSLGATIAGSAMAGTAGYLAENIVAGKQATVEGGIISGASGGAAVMAGAIVDKAVGVLSNTLNNVISSVPDKINKSIAGTKTYQTYTKTNSTTGEVYSGRTSGTRSPVENIRIRDMKHHMNDKGFGPAVLDKSSTNAAAIRGREQQLIDMNGGAKSIGGVSGNAINGIGINNPNRTYYLNQANKEF